MSVVGRRVCPKSEIAVGQVARCRSEAGNCGLVPDVRRVGVDAMHHGTPEVRLPLEVVVEIAAGTVGRLAVEPVDEHLRPLSGGGREEARQASGDGVASATPQLAPRRQCRSGPDAWRAFGTRVRRSWRR